MTQVSRKSASVLARRSPRWTAKRKGRKHKIILESITREKKKLRSVISFETKAPPGYTFISAGDPHFTTTCKELCRRDGMKVYAVSTTPHLHTHGLSQHVHRIGYHFPSAVVAAVCMDRGLYLTATGKAVSIYGMSDENSRKHADSVPQITINTEARDVLKDLFPNIPDNDLNQIIKTAFQKGQRKVGTAVELPLARRAQLAVVAHIRHIYTNYDRLLKATSFHEARATVEQPTLAKLVEWRGDDENGKTVLEDVFREVIVISDDEDSDIEGEPLPSQGRDTSVEVISSKPVIEELHMKPISYGNTARREAHVEQSEDEATPGFRFIPEVPKKAKIDRRGFSRYQAWDRAINKYKNLSSGPSCQPSYSLGDPLQGICGINREPFDRGAPVHQRIEPRQSSTAPDTIPNQRTVIPNSIRAPLQPVAEHHVSNSAVLTLHEPFEPYPVGELPIENKDSLVSLNPPYLVSLKRAPISEPKRRHLQHPDLSNEPVFVSGPRESQGRHADSLGLIPQPSEHLLNRNATQQDSVLPSIESPLPLNLKRISSGPLEHLTKRMSGAFTFRSVTPHRQVGADIPSHKIPQDPIEDYDSKRRRLIYHEPVPLETPLSPSGPGTLRTHPGNRYTVTGHSSMQTGVNVRRRYAAAVEPLHDPQQLPGSAHVLSASTTRFEHEAQAFKHQIPPEAYGNQPCSPSRLGNSQVNYHRSPGQPRVRPATRYAIPIDRDRERTGQPPPRSSDATKSHISRSVHGRNPDETIDPSHEPSLWYRNLADYAPAEKQKVYAEGFVRSIEPSIPEHRPIRRHPASPIMKDPLQPMASKIYGGQHGRVPSDSLLSGPRGRIPYGAQGLLLSQQHSAIGNQDSRQHDHRLSRKQSPVYHYDNQSYNLQTSPRYGHEESPILIGT
ncbi:hypothetical protein BJY04DRAFT_230870 [Aspergillus karnatakaensis]|uniref:DUF2293 domain-containing protein n=1 Tax=Aspergillus karnatakaensis TaxID=1810916 RepID=UPI003CCDCDC4